MPLKKEEVYKKIDAHYRKNYNAYVKRYTWRLGHEQARAEDVVQEAYVRALKYWDKLDSERPIDGWIIGIINTCVLANHNEENLHGMTDRPEGLPDEAVKPVAIPAILIKQVVERINQRPPAVANILHLFLVEQYTDKDIEAMGLARAGNVRFIVHEFRKQIQKEFKWVI